MTTQSPPLSSPRAPSEHPRSAPRDRSRLLHGLAVLAVVLGVLARLHSASALWLDETLSVNLASLPLSQLGEALRHDGSPPLYYVLLHGWVALLGTGNEAVRSLSELFGLAALPLAYVMGRRLRDRGTAWVALLLLATNPFAVRYSTETRMYSLLVLLALAGALALLEAWHRPTPGRLALLAVAAAALAYTHYWSLFLLAVTGLGLLVAAVRGPARRPARRCLAALAAGGVLFVPWLPSFAFQTAHTGTPWAAKPGYGVVLSTWTGWSGAGLPAGLLGLLLLGLALCAVLAHPWRGPDGRAGVVLRLPVRPLGVLLLGGALGSLLLGVLAASLGSSGYALRYSSPALVPALLAAAVGAVVLPGRVRRPIVGAAVALGLLGCVALPFATTRTEAAVTAAALRARLLPGDLVVYCPDQLGPAVDRLLPPGTQQAVFPTGGGPQRIDWVDYAARNRAADPAAFARQMSQRAAGALYLVYAEQYRTFGTDCTQLIADLAALRGGSQIVQRAVAGYGEKSTTVRFPAR